MAETIDWVWEHLGLHGTVASAAGLGCFLAIIAGIALALFFDLD